MFRISVVTKSSALVTMMMLKVISSHSVVLKMVPNVLNAEANNKKDFNFDLRMGDKVIYLRVIRPQKIGNRIFSKRLGLETRVTTRL